MQKVEKGNSLYKWYIGGGIGRRFKRKVKAWASLEQHLTMQGANPCPITLRRY